MNINLTHRPEGATHAGKDDEGGSWYKKTADGQWMFIDMIEDGLQDRKWEETDVPGYHPIELPPVESPTPAIAEVENGGPAFPCHTNPRPGHLADAPQGMTLRDYFAAKALQGMSANPYYDDYDFDRVASMAYSQAEAMLAERERP